MAEAGSQRDADDSVDRLITEAVSLYGYANLKDEQKKVLKSFVEGKDVTETSGDSVDTVESGLFRDRGDLELL